MVAFNELFATAFVIWNAWSLLPISHRSPWGLWTSKQRTWYLKGLAARQTGLDPSVEGTLRLFTTVFIGTAAAFYHASFECDGAMYAAATVVGFVTLAMHKISFDVLFWDYRDPVASFYVVLCVELPLWVAWIFLVAFTDSACSPGNDWVKWLLASAIAVHIALGAYRLWFTWVWWEVSKPDRQYQRRRKDIEMKLLK